MPDNSCDGCAVAYINGVRCHEHGCPLKARECPQCFEQVRLEEDGIYCESCEFAEYY